jgi:AcrR family transcriptional regulator
MNRIATNGRPYRSDLRAQQADETRRRILDATLRVMAGGLASLSIPAVAREAGVSVPTIYRHFRTKAELLKETYPHVARRSGFDGLPKVDTLDELRDGVRAIFDRIDSLDDLARAAMASPGGEEARRALMPDRYEHIHLLGDSIEPKLSKAAHDRITRLLVILTSSAAVRTWRDHLGSSKDEAADDVDWIVRAAIAAASREKPS